MIRACSGRCSLTRMPGTLVGMEANGPRTSAGASGLGSHMSIWLGPPDSQKRITDFFCFGDALAAAGSQFGSDIAPRPARPVCKNQRREPTRIDDTEGFMNFSLRVQTVRNGGKATRRFGRMLSIFHKDEARSSAFWC